MAKLDETTLLSILSRYESEARRSLSTRTAEDNNITARYNAELYGDEIAGRSQVVSEDVKDVVESDMPPLIRSLLNSGPIAKFVPLDPDDELDVKEAGEKTDFVDWIIRGQLGSYKINYDFIKSVEMYKHGVLKCVFSEEEDNTTSIYENIPAGGEQELLNKIESTPYLDRFEVLSTETNEQGLSTFTVKTWTKKEMVELLPVPNGTFLISNGASSVESAAMTGDIATKTRGELISEGYKMDIVKQLPRSDGASESATARQYRFDGEGNPYPGDYGEWANESVEIIDMYAHVDCDMDGIAELRHFIKSGTFILLDEPFGRCPYSSVSAVMTPYSAIGDGRATQVLNIARVKTALERGLLDNTYIHNNPKIHINSLVNRDDAQDDSIGGFVRHKGETPPQNNIFGHNIDYVGDKALFAIQYQDQKKSKLIGNQLTSQGLNADEINNETATRFKGVEKAEAAKLELVVRNIAEIGYKKAALDVIWFAQQFFSKAVTINYQGKSLKVDPSKWGLDHNVGVEVGLGTSNNEQTVGNLTALYQIHTQLKAEQSPLTDEVKRYNVLSDLTKALEFTDVARYFNNPEEPAQLLQAQNELLNSTLQQAQQQIQLLQQQADNPLAEAEMVKREGEIAIAQGKLQLEVAKLEEDKRQFNIDAVQKANKQTEDTALKITELELDNQTDIAGGLPTN